MFLVRFLLAVPRRLWNAAKRVFSAVGTVFVLGLSLLPLSALLLAFPAFSSQETVLTDAAPERQSWLRRTARRIASLALGLTVLLGLTAVSVEIVTRLPLPERGSFAVVARTLLPSPSGLKPLGENEAEVAAKLATMTPDERAFWTTPLHAKLPAAMVQHWPFVILGVYLLDLGVLVLMGNVPLAYNLRNVRVRWKTNLMTGVSFTAVIALLVFLLAFVNGMNNLTENSGVPGNVFVLSDGSTDEIFSNLGYSSEIDNVPRVAADEEQRFDDAGRAVLRDDGAEDWRAVAPLRIRSFTRDGKSVVLASKETFYTINMPVPNTEPLRRRFVQLRTLDDADIAARVHNIELLPGGRWFSPVGVASGTRIECVLGDGIAGTLGEDSGKKKLAVNDEFRLGEMTWVVVGIMKAEGTTFGSEIWAKRMELLWKPFGKQNFTTMVMRTEADTREASRVYANYLSKKYTQQKLRAFSEPDYYAELTKTNNLFLTAIILVCVVMAIGGVFGMMTTMFASIAQRIKDIGVLRLLGFKRWQVTVSFLLESRAVAALGGALGVAAAWLLADGRESTSMLSSGGGGPGGKSVALRIDVSAEVAAMGMLFTLVMGRLGGLVPALSAMRMKILDSLR